MPRSKRSARQAIIKSTTETSKPSLRIEIDAALRGRFRAFDPQKRRQLGEAINQAAADWGKPHRHAGSGIRKLSPTYFECRAGLRTRLVFKMIEDQTLYFAFMGNHDEIRRFIKTTR